MLCPVSPLERDLDGITMQWRSEGAGQTSPGAGIEAHFWGKDKWRNFKIRPSHSHKNGPPNFHMPIWLENGPLRTPFSWPPAASGPMGPYLRHWQGPFLLVNLFKRKIWSICTIWEILVFCPVSLLETCTQGRHLRGMGGRPPQGKRKKKKERKKKEKKEKREKKRKQKEKMKGTMNNVKLLHIKCFFSKFSIVRWH